MVMYEKEVTDIADLAVSFFQESARHVRMQINNAAVDSFGSASDHAAFLGKDRGAGTGEHGDAAGYGAGSVRSAPRGDGGEGEASGDGIEPYRQQRRRGTV